MKFFLAYPVWGGKQDMIPWLLQGISQNISPSKAQIYFLLNIPEDDSIAVYQREAPAILSQFHHTVAVDYADKSEFGLHAAIMREFLKSDCDVLFVPQDDNRINSNRILEDIEKVLSHYGDGMGVIGGRDGFERGYAKMVSSPFSRSALSTAFLPIGEWRPCSMVNTGPMVYTRNLIENIGFPDYAYYEFMYGEVDYALRAAKHGFQNVVLSMEILHEKFGSMKRPYIDGRNAAKDLLKLRARWGDVF